DPAAPVLVGQGQGQVDVGRVGGGGGDLPIGGLDAVVADHVDDGAAALLQHVGQRGVAGPHVTHELQLEGLVPVAGLQVEDAAARCAAGVVDQDVQAPPGVDRLADRPLGVLPAGEVAGDRQHLAAG